MVVALASVVELAGQLSPGVRPARGAQNNHAVVLVGRGGCDLLRVRTECDLVVQC